jgi:hypothetical protein
MQIAFYKGEGGTFTKLIRWWVKHEYTHVELIIGDTWYTSSHIDGGVRARRISGKSGNWDIYEIDGDEEYALAIYSSAVCAKYDWTGIVLSQVVPLGIHAMSRWFCSELVGKMLGMEKTHRLAPHELYEKLEGRLVKWED